MPHPCCTLRIFRFSSSSAKNNEKQTYFSSLLPCARSVGPLHPCIFTRPCATSGPLQPSEKPRRCKSRDTKVAEGDITGMTSAMSGSRGRDSRRPRRVTLFLARLPLLMFSCLLLAHTSSSYTARAQETGQHPPHEEKVEVSMTLSSCADLPNKRTEVYGVVAVEGDIVCREKRVRITTSKDYNAT